MPSIIGCPFVFEELIYIGAGYAIYLNRNWAIINTIKQHNG